MRFLLQISSRSIAQPVLILFFLTFLNAARITAQEIEPTYISISEGLADPNVTDVIQDSYGLLWIATGNGLQTYDGYRFETFKNIPGKPTSLLSSAVWGLVEDADRNIWVATEKGISRFNRMTKSFINYDITEQFNLPANGSIVFNLFQDGQKRLWATTNSKELLLYDPVSDQWNQADYRLHDINEQVLYNGAVMGITEDQNGGLWAGSSNYGLLHRSKNDSAFNQLVINRSDDFSFSDPLNNITGLYADSTNVIWITTRNGVYKYYPKDSLLKTIAEYDYNRENVWNHWNSILPDPEGNIVIANNYRGMLKFEGISDRYKEIPVAGSFKLKNLGYNVTLTDFTIDKSGIYWIGNRTLGLIKYDPEKKPFVHYSHDETNPSSISSDAVFGLLASRVKPGILYVGTAGFGLNIFDKQKQTFRQVKYNAINDYYGGAVRSIGEDEDGTIWLGTWGDGLIELDQNYNEIKRYTYSPQSLTGISDNNVRVIKNDKAGNFWIGTNNGLNYFEPKTGKFKRILGRQSRTYPPELIDKIEDEVLSKKNVGDILQVTDFQNLSKTIEIKEAGEYLAVSVGEGTNGSMLDYGWIENSEKDTIWTSERFYDTYYAGGGAKNRILIDQITLTPDTYNLRYISDDSHSYDKWNADPPDLTSLYGIVILKIDEQSSDILLESLMKQNEEQMTISGVSITALWLNDRYLWVCTGSQGLNKIDLQTSEVTEYFHDPADENSLNSNTLYDIYEDQSGMLWITTNAGICTFNPETETFTRYTEEDGLPTNLTESILPGDNGELWISTQSGLSQMVMNGSLGKVTFINFNSEDGLGGNTFLSQAAARTADGKLYFGGDHGLNVVSKITANDVPPDLIITDLLISNKSVYATEGESMLSVDLFNLEELDLSYDQNSLSFEFAALHYANPRKNQYAHMLKGYDKEWIYDNRNYASYTNLDPGTYEFKIRASNAYGVWNEAGKSIRLIISPPWYRTVMAYTIYVLLFLTALYGFDRFMRHRLILRERERSREKELAQAREIEKAYKELKETQSQLIQSEKMASLGELTAGIAHEIQNPLNFVNNFADVSKELIEEMNEELENGDISSAKEIAVDINNNLEKIHHHGQRASSIVKGMLEHSRTGNNEKEPTDLNALADEYLRLAYHGLRAKDQSFKADFKAALDEKLPQVPIISQDMGRVLLNLINNAFYAVDKKAKSGVPDYKPEVIVKTEKLPHSVEIRVKDNGEGIPKEIKEKIFQPFFTTKPSGSGTGLGLSLSYDIVKAHGGELKVESKPGTGSEFIIQLPLD